jgi:hypothetical protein
MSTQRSKRMYGVFSFWGALLAVHPTRGQAEIDSLTDELVRPVLVSWKPQKKKGRKK